MANFSPREIVSELDRFIVGQNEAKKAVAVALRNRWRRMQVSEHLREEIVPKNILMSVRPASAKPKSPDGWPNSPKRRLLRLKRPSLPKSAM